MAKVLVIYHSQSGNTQTMAQAVARGAESVAGTEVTVKRALEAALEDLLACDGLALGSPDYFSYMAGGLKDFFDRTYYPSQGKVTGKPYVAFVSAGGGGRRALDSVERICSSFRFKRVAEPVVAAGRPSPEKLAECEALGRRLAQSI
jgi:multimeric flavodoxin WrbA